MPIVCVCLGGIIRPFEEMTTMLSFNRNINAAAIMNAKAFMWNKRAEVPSSKGIKTT